MINISSKWLQVPRLQKSGADLPHRFFIPWCIRQKISDTKDKHAWKRCR